MMKWQIPAKTFLLGEYAALAGLSAIVLTTDPCFELSLTQDPTCNPLHPDSPAGLWWKEQALNYGLQWFDPYQGRGGLGASSAQFLACYLAACHLRGRSPNYDHMLQSYIQVAWTGKGLKPSAYDLTAQSQQGCVFINRQKQIIKSYAWPFEDLAFFLVHTGVKLATHTHLQESLLPKSLPLLSAIVEDALAAFKNANSERLLASISQYHKQLLELGLVAQHSMDMIEDLQSYSEILAIKGCGALGSDILLILCSNCNKLKVKNSLHAKNFSIVATELELRDLMSAS